MIKKVIKPDPFNRFYYIDLVYKIMRGGLNAPPRHFIMALPEGIQQKAQWVRCPRGYYYRLNTISMISPPITASAAREKLVVKIAFETRSI